MLDYNPILRDAARDLRKNQTEAENRLWAKLRRKQLCGVGQGVRRVIRGGSWNNNIRGN